LDRVCRRVAEDGDREDPAPRAARAGKGLLSVASPALRDVVVDGKRLETAWFAGSDPARPAIVLLHEGLGSIGLWRDFPARLAARTGCGVLAYSRYGYGRSEPLRERREPEYMHHEGRVVLPELLAQLEIERPILLGHSDGASIALLYAAGPANDPRALVLVAPHVFVEELSVRSIAQAKIAYETSDLRAKLARHHDDVDGAFFGWNDIWLDPRFRAWNIEPAVEGVRCRVLLIQGEADEYGTSAQVDAIAARLPRSEALLVADAGHSPHRDAPELVLERVSAFVEGVAAR
jgi:pimeloyl-ACP methyl ester carboxylesterase